TITFTYDNLNRVLAETLNGKTTAYAYNTNMRSKVISYPSGKLITEKKDLRERLVSVTENSNSIIAQISYDLGDRLITKTLGNGITQNYTYDANNRVTSLNCQPNDVLNFQYSYDKEGHKLSVLKNHRPTHSEKYL